MGNVKIAGLIPRIAYRVGCNRHGVPKGRRQMELGHKVMKSGAY